MEEAVGKLEALEASAVLDDFLKLSATVRFGSLVDGLLQKASDEFIGRGPADKTLFWVVRVNLIQRWRDQIGRCMSPTTWSMVNKIYRIRFPWGKRSWLC